MGNALTATSNSITPHPIRSDVVLNYFDPVTFSVKNSLVRRVFQTIGQRMRKVETSELSSQRLYWKLQSLGALMLFQTLAAHAGVISDGALSLLHSRADESRTNFFVFRNADDPLNHGFPSGFYGVQQNLHVDTTCIFSTSNVTGCATSPSALDTNIGTVLHIVVDPLSPDEYCGLNFEEPQGFSGTRTGSGYDLSSVTSVKFRVSSPTGVVFYPTFADTGYWGWLTVSASTNWQTIVLPVSPDSTRTNVNILFGLGFNDTHGGGTLLLDDIQFLPAPYQVSIEPSLPVSFQTFGAVYASTPPFPPDQGLRNVASLYDVACSTLTFIGRGTTNDLATARKFADTIVYILGHPNSGLYLPSSADGAGVFSGVSAGPVVLYNDQQGGAKSGETRLAGFSCGVSPNGFCVVLDQGAAGDNAWTMLALLAAYREFHDTSYLQASRTIGHWLREFLLSNDGFGGYLVGYQGDGTPSPKPLLQGKSVEHNADVFAAMLQLATVERALQNTTEADQLEQSAYHAGDFVLSLYNPSAARFYAGTVPMGTSPGPGIDTNGPVQGNDVANAAEFLDLATFPFFSMANHPRYAAAVQWSNILSHTESRFIKTITSGGTTYSGFALCPAPITGADGIALEFTSQLASAFNYWDALNHATVFSSSYEKYRSQIAIAQQSAPFGDGQGLVSAILQNGELLNPADQVLSNPFENNIPMRVGLNATTWAAMMDLQINPLQSAMRIVRANFTNNVITLEWTSLIGGQYVIERTDTLKPDSVWTPVVLPIRGTGWVHITNIDWSDFHPAFFRIRLI